MGSTLGVGYAAAVRTPAPVGIPNPDAAVPAVRLSGVAKTYPARRGLPPTVALKAVDLAVRTGEFVAIVGPSGCGKSTLLRLVAGLTGADAGEVVVRGERVRGPRSDVGLAFQRPVLLPWRTVAGNLRLPAEVLRLPRDAARAREAALLDLVGLAGFGGRYPSELSGGMQQRVALARALAHDPPILLLDEPFGALDALLRERMAVELQRIWRAPVTPPSGGTAAGRSDRPAAPPTTVLLVTHSVAEAVFLADRVVTMTPRPGTIADILAVDLPRPRTLEVLDGEPFTRATAHVRRALHATGAL